MKLKCQNGVTTVEFAIIGAVMLLVLFSVIEIGRTMFVLGALSESTRRAARMAAVCPIDDPAIAEVGLFNAPGEGTGTRFIRGLSAANFAVEYLDGNGTVVASPATNFGQIQFVRTRIVNFQHQMLIPFASYLLTTPDFATTLRRESLGVPRDGVIEPC
jgi:Flp pilus assembly protein TadG